MKNGVVTFCFEAESDDEVFAITEKILEAVESLGLPVSASEDYWDEEGDQGGGDAVT